MGILSREIDNMSNYIRKMKQFINNWSKILSLLVTTAFGVILAFGVNKLDHMYNIVIRTESQQTLILENQKAMKDEIASLKLSELSTKARLDNHLRTTPKP